MKEFQLQEKVLPHIVDLKPYSSARDEFTGDAEVYLDANENPFDDDYQWNRYPDPYQRQIKTKLSELKSVKPERIFLGNGSDEAIDLLFRIFCQGGKDNVITNVPTYGMYAVSASIHNVENRTVSLTDDYQLDLKAIFKSVDANTKMIFICSPNNPSGNSIKRSDILGVIEKFDGIVVIDEAYIDFSDEVSFTQVIDEHSNIVVLQTLSKAWGLAAVRLGMAFANESIIHFFNKVKPPYNISGPNQQEVIEALEKVAQQKEKVEFLLKERSKMELALSKLAVVEHINPSDANFILVRMKNASQIYQDLIRKGIILRDRSKVHLCDNSLRITVGTAKENQILVEELAKLS